MKNITGYNIYETSKYTLPDSGGRIEGKKFLSDQDYVKYADRVEEIIIYSGEIIDGIQFMYSGNTAGCLHGNTNSKCAQSKFKLETDEYITTINWTTIFHNYYGGQVLKNVSFITNKNRKFEVNGKIQLPSENTYNYKCKETQKIVGLESYTSNYCNIIKQALCRDVQIKYNDEMYYYDDYFSIINAKKVTKICGYSALVVDKLQFVYDDNTEISKMHGNGNGSWFEFQLEPDEYINKLIWHTSLIDFPDGYGKSPVLGQIEIYTNKNRKFIKGYYEQPLENLSKHFRDSIHPVETYTHEAKADEEIFCLAGVFSKYMGRIIKVYNRKKSPKDVQYNSDGKEILYIDATNIYEQRNGVKENINLLEVENLASYKQLNSVAIKNNDDNTAYLPEKKNVYKDTKISIDDYMKAVQNKQYKYINICNNTSNTIYEKM